MTLVPTAGPDTEAALAATDLGSALKALSKREVSLPAVPSKEPKIVKVTAAQKDALAHLAKDANGLEFPTERRALTTLEKQQYLLVKTEIATVKKFGEKVNDNIRTAVFNHLDAEAFDAGVLADVAADGHVLAPGEIVIDGTGQKFTREITNPQPYVTAEGLDQLYRAGKITQEQYMKATRKPIVPRELDEEGLLEVIKGDPSVINVLSEILVQDAPQARFWIRPVEGTDG